MKSNQQSRISAFQIIKKVGEGSFGKVYKATEKATGSIVALKILNKRGRNARDLKLLRREQEIQRNLNHPNIIRMLEAFETENEMVVVSEYAKLDLHTLLGQEGSLGVPRAQKLTYELVSALYYLHSHRILHRDLKPQNVLIDLNQTAKLCDFGLARNMTMSTHVLTSIKGTPLYMAPELLEGKPYDHQADLWSLGCIIYETLAGEPPFYTTSILHLVRLIRSNQIKWPTFLTPECYSFLDSLLVIDPTQRIGWTHLLEHPFVKGNILILESDTPFAMSDDQRLEKELQAEKIMFPERTKRMPVEAAIESLPPPKPKSAFDENLLTTSQDSVHAILQSDIEGIETDLEDMQARKIDSSSTFTTPSLLKGQTARNICTITGNSNLMINRLNDNFPQYMSSTPQDGSAKGKQSLGSQNLPSLSSKTTPDDSNLKNESRESHDRPESALDSGEDSQNPPIENEEWLIFIQRTMQEILEGDLESFKQQSFVSFVVAPLRNSKASPKVMETVAKLFSLPMAINGPSSLISEIISIYLEVKLIPNLMYASRLLCRTQQPPPLSVCQSPPLPSNPTYRELNSLSPAELRTLCSLYELVCHLIHYSENQNFLSQFYDAVAILGIDRLLSSILSSEMAEKSLVRLKATVLALLAFALRESPENAEVIERIVLSGEVNFADLLRHPSAVIRLRSLMLLRILLRFCCSAMQKQWNVECREALERLADDEEEKVQKESTEVIEEFQNFAFYQN